MPVAPRPRTTVKRMAHDLPTFTTQRLTLRGFTLADADAVFDIFSRPEVARWSGQGVAMTDRAEAVARIGRQPERAGTHPATDVFAVVDGSGVVGMAMLVPIPASAGFDGADLEIGWHFHPRAWGHGYATEAARALIDRAWEFGVDRLVAVTHPDNARSQAVCGRLGMTDLGLRDDWYDATLRAFELTRALAG